jgi:hypothetical protein
VRGVDPSNYTVFLVTILFVVAVGATVVYRLKRDEREDRPVTDEDIAREFERAYFAGEMDEAEYRRVSESLRARKAGVLKVDPAPETAPEPVPEPSPEPATEPAAEGPGGPHVEAGAGPN